MEKALKKIFQEILTFYYVVRLYMCFLAVSTFHIAFSEALRTKNTNDDLDHLKPFL